MFEQLQPAVNDFIVVVITGLLSVLSGFLIALAKKGFNWVSEKIDTLQNEKLRSDADQALKNLETLVTTTVTALQQSIGDDIKTSLSKNDGIYTKEDLLALKNQAIETIKHQLTDSSKEVLSQTYSDLDTFIEDLVEVAVRSLKTTNTEDVNKKTKLLG